MRPRWLLAALALLGCKAEGEQTTRPLPAPEPPSATKSELVPAAMPPEPRKERPPREVKSDAERTKPEAEEPAAPTPTATAPVASAAPAADVSCQQACQASLQTCLAQAPADPDGGTSLEGLAGCKKALDECRARCLP